MTGDPDNRSLARSWWLALAAVVACSPWPGWAPGWAPLLLVVVLLALLARPARGGWWLWIGVLPTLAGAVAPTGGVRTADELAAGFERHCREVLATASKLVEDRNLRRIFTTTGEAIDPTRAFAILDGVADPTDGRTIYLADDRGRILAWAGADRGFPARLRPLGPRVWDVEWSALRGVLSLREPLMIEGRIVGSVTISDRVPIRTTSGWGMSAALGRLLVFDRGADGAALVATGIAPGIEISVASSAPTRRPSQVLLGLGWLALIAVGLALVPRLAWTAVAFALALTAVADVGPSTTGQMVLVLAAGLAVGRLGRTLSRRWAVILVAGGLAGAVAVELVLATAVDVSWLPGHLLQPGWGGIWMIALAWMTAGWPTLARGQLPLERRLAAAVLIGLLALLVDLVWYPVRILDRAGDDRHGVVLPRGAIDVDALLPAPPEQCRFDDLAPAMARRWGLDRWDTPSRLAVVGVDGRELSSWGDLSPAGERRRLLQSWDLVGLDGGVVGLEVATEPWNLVSDWASGEPFEDVWRRPVWSAVLTRSGAVAATLHPEIGDLGPTTAGEAYHAGAIWTRIRVGDSLAPARVVRRGEWLVATVAHPPEPTVWVVRTAIATLWAMLGLLIVRPPRLRREQFATFGGRLRLLVAGGVVIPLVILTLFLQLRLGREEARLEKVFGLHALDAARYTIEHLGAGSVINDQLAAWLARGWGGEVVFFHQTNAVAVSRPDLMAVGRLPQLPAVEAYPAYLLGRSDAVVLPGEGRLTSAATVDIGDDRLLLHLHRSDPLRTIGGPDAVDWLLTGALLAALVALIATGRIEERLGASLRDLVDLAGRLVRGEPLGSVRRPRETDLAEVLDAVRSMNEEVHRRELSLRYQEEMLRITLANLAPAVMVLEPDGKTSFTNPSAEELLGEHRDEVLDRVRELVDGADGPEGSTTTVQPIPGRDLTWRIGAAEAPLPDGRRGLVVVIDDVTDVVRADRLQQLNQLARIVAHEVKNPLTPIRLWVQELGQARRRRDAGIEGLIDEACAEIGVQVERLQSTASSFSNLVALEQWQPVTIDIAELITAATRGLAVLERRGIALVLDLPPAGSVIVTADRQWLMRAVSNLVQNSIDAVGDDGGEIRIEARGEGATAVVEVEDSGGGVPHEQLQDLFSPHFSTTASGSGLGLALVHQVATRCQGRVEATNGDRGLIVRIELPRS